jgi:hypothetical protein
MPEKYDSPSKPFIEERKHIGDFVLRWNPKGEIPKESLLGYGAPKLITAESSP